MKITTRFAPSPTGSLHIGGLRTALYAYAYAIKHNGDFILRIEDTDRKRFVKGSIDVVFDNLKIFGLHPNRCPSPKDVIRAEAESDKDLSVKGWILQADKLRGLDDDSYKNMYIQSQRVPLYQKYALKLLEQADAYICFATEEELTKLRGDTQLKKQRFVYRGSLGKYTLDEARERIKSGENFVVRLDVEAYKAKKKINTVSYDGADYPLDEVDDQVLMKSNGIPTYHLAVVVDDHFMGVTHPMRAAEWIPSTPKQVMLYDMLGWEMPLYIHLTTILNANGHGKLSKRDGSVSTAEFLQEGYLPQAILNFIMLLGWSSPEKHEHGIKEREFFSLREFIELFDIKDLNKSNPIFNREKLLWFNQKYISNLENKELLVIFKEWIKNYARDFKLGVKLEEKGEKYLLQIMGLIKERIKLLKEIEPMLMPFYESVTVPDFVAVKQTQKINMDIFKKALKEFREVYLHQASIDSWGHEAWEKTVREIAEKNSLKAAELFMGLRLVMLGSPFSPPLYESMEVLGDAEVKSRLNAFLD